eukprot:EG_transcript_6149
MSGWLRPRCFPAGGIACAACVGASTAAALCLLLPRLHLGSQPSSASSTSLFAATNSAALRPLLGRPAVSRAARVRQGLHLETVSPAVERLGEEEYQLGTTALASPDCVIHQQAKLHRQGVGVSAKEALVFNVGSLSLLSALLWSKWQRQSQGEEGSVAMATTIGQSEIDLLADSRGVLETLQQRLRPLAQVDFVLFAYFAFWFLGNYYYNIFNKTALDACGGASGFPLTVAAGQLFIGALYPIFLWAAPDARAAPRLTAADVRAMLPVSLCAAGAHCSSVFALGAGAVSFAQIVKAAEPAFAAVLGMLFYGKAISPAKWLCLVPVIGGVALASATELDFSWVALFAAAVANLFAAVKGNENKKLMESRGIKERLGSVGNQFAVTSVLSFLLAVPVVVVREGDRFPEFLQLFAVDPVLQFNMVSSGLVFYAYNELATLTIEKTNAVTQSVANTAKRVIVIVGVAMVLGESLEPLKLLGCAIGIGGVFLYSIIDSLGKPSSSS